MQTFTNALLATALLFASCATAQFSNSTFNASLQAVNTTSFLSVLARPELASVAQLLASPQSNYTVFVPSNAALDAFSQNVTSDVMAATLQYHVLNAVFNSSQFAALQFPSTLLTNATYVNLNGSAQVVGVSKDNTTGAIQLNYGLGSANVIQANVPFANGVIHVIDKVLSIPSNVSTTAAAANLTSFIATLNRTNLTATANTIANVTIFAPVDGAFVNLAAVPLNATQMNDTMKYHLVPSATYSVSLKDGLNLTTVQGTNITVTVKGGDTFVNGAKVLKANVLTSNGVMHVIDAVMTIGGGNAGSATPTASASVKLGGIELGVAAIVGALMCL